MSEAGADEGPEVTEHQVQAREVTVRFGHVVALDRFSTSAWPISPEAPVIKTTFFRILSPEKV